MKKHISIFMAIIAAALSLVGCNPEKEPTPVPLDVPSNVSLAAGGATSSSLTFVWDAVEGATSYGYKYKDSAGNYISDQVATNSVTIRGLKPSTEYMFAVRAIDAERKSDYSLWVTATTLKDGENPDPDPDPDPDPTFDFEFPESENDAEVRAFPGAEGGGMYVTGGRGGKVLHVTNLNDSGEGSLRWAVGQKGARTIVFDVAGKIELLSDLKISNGDLTIAGQSAPGDGVCLSGATVVVNADNIIIRYMRFRLGDLNTGKNLGDGSDAVWGRYHANIILDHCSMSWSVDEVASFYANRNFTMQWCVVAEALRQSVHTKKSHGYGGIWGGRNASFHHNMLAHNDSRNARIDHPGIYIPDNATDYRPTHRGNVDYRNNVIYNWGSNSTYGGEDGSFNIVGNYYKPGPASSQRNYFVDAYWYNSSSKIGTAYPRIYLSDNHHAGSYASAINADNWNGGVYFHSQGTNPSQSDARLNAPLPIKADDTRSCYTTTHSSETAFERVLTYCGAVLKRDAVDSRIADNARNATANAGNGLINSQSEVGGWPEYTASQSQTDRLKDTDLDGMPDYWEQTYSLDVNDASDGNDKTLDSRGRYTNLEVYLHWLVKDITKAQTAGGTYTKLD